MTNKNQQYIEEWMSDVAKKRPPKIKLCFDPKNKTIVPCDTLKNGTDESIQFIPEESKRFLLL